jgi:hypothetical protein
MRPPMAGKAQRKRGTKGDYSRAAFGEQTSLRLRAKLLFLFSFFFFFLL